jgi:TPR repeat protein
VEPDPARGAALLARAAALAHREAQLHLGHAYRLGRGVDRDPVEAYKWYVLAAQKGGAAAKVEAGKLEQSLNVDELAEGRSRAVLWTPATGEPPAVQTDR